MRGGPAAGGGRWVEVDPARLERWLAGFEDRHGSVAVNPQVCHLVVAAFDGSVAELHPPPGAPAGQDIASFLALATLPRRIGLLLARRGGYAAAVADGDRLLSSKVDSRYVQGRTAAGGWSQQRFARRRDNQARATAEAAAELAVTLLLPEVEQLAAVVSGGDRRAVAAVLSDRRLIPVAAKVADRFLDVPDPRQSVLPEALRKARAVLIKVMDPEPA